MKFTLKNEEIQDLNGRISPTFPKYTSQLINLGNQNAQGTRPKIVGQMSDLFPEYLSQSSNVSVEDWENWYLKCHSISIKNATDKIFLQIENLQKAITLVDRDMVESWVRDLLIIKTYNGMYVQQAVLKAVAIKKSLPYRLASPKEEATGIDEFIGNIAYSIKPDTYKIMDRLSEEINVKMIFYTKTKAGLNINIDE